MTNTMAGVTIKRDAYFPPPPPHNHRKLCVTISATNKKNMHTRFHVEDFRNSCYGKGPLLVFSLQHPAKKKQKKKGGKKVEGAEMSVASFEEILDIRMYYMMIDLQPGLGW